MRIFVYEFITGGGLFSDPTAPLPQGSLLDEGRAMVQAITTDLAALPEVRVSTTRDLRLSTLSLAGCQVSTIGSATEERDALAARAAAADWTLLIAPETAGSLIQRAEWILAAGGRLLSPGPAVIRLAGDKQATADWLIARGIPVPRGLVIAPSASWPYQFPLPAVVKPIDGCGSQAVQQIYSELEFAALECPMRLEVFVPGLAASVAVLCGPEELVALPACEQRLTSDGRFGYLGGRTPLAADLDRRGRKLALAAVATLPSPIGYIGVDLVLGESGDGSDDYVIEINPRLTTSYVGLRAACRENLAGAMLAVALGKSVALSFDPEPVEFDASGKISRDAFA